MNLVTQEPGDQCCGAACLAMLTDLSFETACYHCRYGRIRASKLLSLIKGHGCLYTADLVFIRGPRRAGHWIVRHEGNYFDPERGILKGLPEGWRAERIWPLRPATN